jgi:hypothetical protein
MVMLLSFWGEWILAAVIFIVMLVLIYRAAIRQEMEENPWKYRKDDCKDNSQLPTDEF